jgi:hypothetical protein
MSREVLPAKFDLSQLFHSGDPSGSKIGDPAIILSPSIVLCQQCRFPDTAGDSVAHLGSGHVLLLSKIMINLTNKYNMAIANTPQAR